jgi:uncharacterized damage-inducible protein DinB
VKTDVIASLIDYMYWVNHRLLDAAQHLDTEQWTAANSTTVRSLRATLVHELDVEWSWRLNLQGRLAEDERELAADDFPDLASLRQRWAADEAEMRRWIAGLTDQDLDTSVASELSRDERPLWQYLIHIVTHAAQQHADAATILTTLGHSPGDIGYPEFLKQQV